MRALVVSLILLGTPTAVASQWVTQPEECTRTGLQGRCGVLSVPEDPAAPDGRRLEIQTFVLEATDPQRRALDPILILEGGPGAWVLGTAPMHASTFARARQTRDVVFVEQRGTGGESALRCGLGAASLLDPSAIRACRTELEERVDLRFYGTTHAVADLAAALDALDYEKVNVFGVSYGTRTALELVRRHPERVRTVSLLGTYPPGRNAVLDAPWILDRSLDLVAQACDADEDCRLGYPDLEDATSRLNERLESGDLGIDRLDVASTLRLMMFYPVTMRQVPSVIDAAAHRDLTPLRRVTAQVGTAFGGIADGAFLSLLCSEDVARLSEETVASAAEGTLLRGSWAEALMAACGEWRRADVADSFHEPYDGKVPLLSLTGELDPSMPPSYGEELAEAWTGGRHLTLPEAPHGLLGMQGVICVVELLESFLAAGSAEELDAGCLADLKRPAFALPAP